MSLPQPPIQPDESSSDPAECSELPPEPEPVRSADKIFYKPDLVGVAKYQLRQKLSEDQDLKNRFPRLPCKLSDALRLVANSPQADEETLEKAFVEFLAAWPSGEQLKKEGWEIIRIKDALAHYTKCYDQLLPDEQDGHNIDSELAEFRGRLEDLESRKTARKKFKPGMELPSSMVDEAKSVVVEHTEGVDHLKMWNLLDGGFGKFWGKHGPKYLHIYKHRKTGPSSREMASMAKNSNRKTSHKSWTTRVESLIRSQDFGDLILDHDQSANMEKFKSVVQSCSKQSCKDPRTRKKIAAFIILLYNYQSREIETCTAEFETALRKEKVKDIFPKTIIACHQILKDAIAEKRQSQG